MKFGLHFIGVSLSALLVVLAAWGAMWPASVPRGMSEAALLAQIQAVRQERESISAQWGNTVEAITQMSVRPSPSAAVVSAPRRRPAQTGIDRTGVWSPKAEAARVERREWIAEELRKRGAE
jgi:hypothetical protein